MALPSQQGPAAEVLNGWKEISSYLNISMRTAQRCKDLPIGRRGGKGGVIALRSELDQWMKARTAEGAERQRTREVDQPVRTPSPAPPPAPGLSVAGSYQSIILALPLIAAVVFSLLVPVPPKPAAFADFSVLNGVLYLLDVSGRQSRSVNLPVRLNDYRYRSPAARARANHVLDVNADGVNDLLFAADAEKPEPGAGFYLIDGMTGRERWHRRPPDIVHFNGSEYGPPWRPYVSMPYRTSAGRTVLLLGFIHGSSSPSVVIAVDEDGRKLSEYWQDGYPEQIAVEDFGGRQAFVVSGTNDETGGGSIALFFARLPVGQAPVQRVSRACAECGTDAPDAFIVFPRRDIAQALRDVGGQEWASVTVDRFSFEAGHTLIAYASEGNRDAEGFWRASVKYKIGVDLSLLDVAKTDGLVTDHEDFVLSKMISPPHGVEADRPHWKMVDVWTRELRQFCRMVDRTTPRP